MSQLTMIWRRGLIYSLGVIFQRLVPEWLFRMRTMVVYELAVDRLLELEAADVQVRQVDSAGDLALLKSLTRCTLSAEATNRHAGYLATRDGKALGGAWCAGDFFEEQELGICWRLQNQVAWVYSAYVLPAHRGLGVYSAILNQVARQMEQPPGTRLLLAVNPWNRASNYVHAKYAKRKIGSVIVLRFFRLGVGWSSKSIRKSQRVTCNTNARPIDLYV